jgi:CheY-like chemotaxis protein
VTVSASEEGGQVVLRVRDTGIGIERDVLPRVFDLFVQGRQGLDRSEGGLGLGLTIVRNLVERHGGKVTAHSGGRGTGSEFVVRLPRATTTDVPGDALDLLPAAYLPAAPAAASRRILIVDDNVDGAEMLAAALSGRGYDLRIAHDAPSALQIAAEFHPDVAFLDIGLPVMDGYELAVRLRELPGLDAIRLVALTGYGQESDRRRTREIGFHHHLVKPVALEDVAAVVDAR